MAVARFRQIVRPQSLSDEVGAALEACIRSGELAPGARLPTEAQLATQFGVSRTVVREAIARLKAEGLVESRQGAGAFVVQRLGSAIFRMNDAATGPQDAVDVFELRLIVETAAAERAALRHTADGLAAIGAALAQMDAVLAAGVDGAASGAVADDSFHCAIAAASGNPLIRRFVEFVSHDFSGSRQPTWSRDGQAGGLARASQDEHRRLYEAIAAGDALAAKAAAERHLRGAAKRLGITLPATAGGYRNREED